MQELNIHALALAKQAAKGAPAAAPIRRLIQVAGDLKPGQERGSENWSDLSKYGGATDWINNVAGNGAPSVEATPEELAFLLWLAHGAETVTPIVGPPAKQTHTFIPGNLFFWFTAWKRLGRTQIDRQAFADGRIGQTVVEGSTANKAVRVTQTMFFLDPAINKLADPAWPDIPAKAPFLYTDGAGSFELDGVVHRGQSQFTLTINEDLQPQYGDDVTIHDFAIGSPVVTIGATVFLDAEGHAFWNKQIFGTANPGADARPLSSIPPLGSYAFDLKARDSAGVETGDAFRLDIPGVQWQVPEKPDPAIGGGAAEIALAGAMRPTEGGEPYTLEVDCDELAFA